MAKLGPVKTAIPSGIGRTAMYMSLIRHRESGRPDALFRDPFAEVVTTRLAGTPELAELATGLGADIPSLARRLDGAEFAYFPVRTRFFDDHLDSALRGGVRQIVTLAAGLDGRPVRLDCPPGTHWYELDLPAMTAFKNDLLAESGLPATCTRHGVAADLTADWRAPLLAAGFDPAQRTAWLLEGLLMYLPGEVGDELIGSVTALSAPGGELLLEHMATATLAAAGTIRDAVESQGTTFLSARDDLAGWLGGHGWSAEVHAGSDPAIGHGRAVSTSPAGWLGHAVLP